MIIPELLFEIPDFLFGIYTLQWPRGMMHSIEIEAAVSSPTIISAQRCGPKSDLAKYQQREILQFFLLVYVQHIYGQLDFGKTAVSR